MIYLVRNDIFYLNSQMLGRRVRLLLHWPISFICTPKSVPLFLPRLLSLFSLSLSQRIHTLVAVLGKVDVNFVFVRLKVEDLSKEMSQQEDFIKSPSHLLHGRINQQLGEVPACDSIEAVIFHAEEAILNSNSILHKNETLKQIHETPFRNVPEPK